MIMPAVWSVALFAVVSATDHAGASSSVAPLESAALVKSQQSASPPQMCVHRSGGSRAAKALPTYVVVAQRGGPPREIGSVLSKELRCFVVPSGSFSVQLNNHSLAGASVDLPAPDICANRIEVSGLRAGWIQVSLHAQGGRPGCPWTVRSKVGSGPLPTIAPRNGEMVEKDFVVLPAIVSYTEAHQVARTAARRLGLKLDLRRARPDGYGRLTFSAADCKANNRVYPCFVSRGRQDDGSYVSLDVADRFFDNEAQGYLVILGSGPKDDPSTRALAEKARSLFPLAELRTDDVWQGRIR
jgi:hypothetical protein